MSLDDDLTDAARRSIHGMWTRVSARSGVLADLAMYAAGRAPGPTLEPGASDELRDISSHSRVAMCRVVLRTYNRGLSAVGFRSPNSETDEDAWEWWQHHRMDARQQLAHRPALTYGTSYVSLLPDDVTGDSARPGFWNPRNAQVDYDEPSDVFPRTALLMKKTAEGISVLLVDDTTVTPGILRPPSHKTGAAAREHRFTIADIEVTGEPWNHGAHYDGRPVCPVVRFVDDSEDDERRGVGVVAPVIDLERSLTSVNYNRLCVAQFGAHDQKLIIGWTSHKDRLVQLSTSRIGAIDEHPEDIRIDSWKPSPLSPYNELIRELREQVALEAAIPLWAAGTMSNVSTDTAAMIESAHQRELSVKRDSFGESWETVLRLAVAMNGVEMPPEDAEIIWRDTAARSFAAVVDGIVKLSSIPAQSEGVPIEELLDLIPGMTQQRIRAIRDGLRRNRTASIIRGLAGLTDLIQPDPDPEAIDPGRTG